MNAKASCLLICLAAGLPSCTKAPVQPALALVIPAEIGIEKLAIPENRLLFEGRTCLTGTAKPCVTLDARQWDTCLVSPEKCDVRNAQPMLLPPAAFPDRTEFDRAGPRESALREYFPDEPRTAEVRPTQGTGAQAGESTR